MTSRCWTTFVSNFGSLALLVLLCVPPAEAQHAHHVQSVRPSDTRLDSTVEHFVLQARKASLPYERLEAAIAAGYRQVGPDFPGMGEHWVHIRQAVQPEIDPMRPPVLSYVRVEGRPVLTGVAYTLPLRPGETPPTYPAPGVWHTHDGSIDEETLLLNPPPMHHTGTSDEVRLAMLHVWVWAENPSGVFEQDNWALAFLRLGLPVPGHVTPQAGKALFLLSGGVDYYARLIDVAGSPSPEDAAAARTILEKYKEAVAAAVTEHEDDDGRVAALSDLWLSMWSDIESGVANAIWDRIRMLAG